LTEFIQPESSKTYAYAAAPSTRPFGQSGQDLAANINEIQRRPQGATQGTAL